MHSFIGIYHTPHMDGNCAMSAVETELLNRLTTNQWSVVPFLFWFG